MISMPLYCLFAATARRLLDEMSRHTFNLLCLPV
jgi:hypothetical protein